ncbi:MULTISPECIES: DUF6415 family natural product biosynthesis protein [unclassified Streptomyces]|uniref:DUF6415 family natural product biosynthesis protein n=1 Tax=unclassified Streptomyces TaxID=2593676 RepID=UPI0018E97BDF|nr:DUF6415 family natural product biosynthesis protein [Streptomyces sp. TSRI0107]
MHTRAAREIAVATWLLNSADDRTQARTEWDDTGLALFRCGGLFTAVRMEADLVHAAAGTTESAGVDAYLDAALLGGPVVADRRSGRFYALVPPSATRRSEWVQGRHFGAACLAPGTYLGVPRPDLATPVPAYPSWWCVQMDGPGVLCDADAVSQLCSYARYRLVMTEGAVTGAAEASRIDVELIRDTCQRALWDPTPSSHAEIVGLIQVIEGYIRQLSPVVAALVPRMRRKANRETALVVLRHVDEVLDERQSPVDAVRRLHDVGVVARSLLGMYEHPGELSPVRTALASLRQPLPTETTENERSSR